MSDQLTPEHPSPPTPALAWGDERLPEPRPSGRWQGPVIVLLFVVAGVLLGVLWEHLWSPTEGRVVRHETTDGQVIVEADVPKRLRGRQPDGDGEAQTIESNIG